MNQPEHNLKPDANLAIAEPKHGRGRPAKADALTPAQRAKRYREAKRLARVSTTAEDTALIVPADDGLVGENPHSLDTQFQHALAIIVRLRGEHKLLKAERASAFRAYDQLAATMAGREDELSKAKAELAAIRADNEILAA